MRLVPRGIFALLPVAAVAACSGSDSTSPPPPPPPPAPATVNVTGGGQLSFIGATVQLNASVLDQNGQAMTGQTVTWGSSSQGVATVSAAGVVTARGNGSAQISATAGSASGSVTVQVELIPTAIEAATGVDQSGRVGQALAESVGARVLDSGGSPIPGVQVAARVEAGGGSLSPESGQTGSDGIFSTEWLLGSSVDEEHRVVFTVGSLDAEVTATPLPAAPQTIVITSGDDQVGRAGEALDELLGVRIEDEFGNVVPGETVNWSSPAGQGSFSPSSSTTDEDGIATTTWTMGGGTGDVLAIARVGEDVTTVFSATAVPGPPHLLSIVSGDEQTGYAAEPLDLPLAVRVEDSFGNGVPDETVIWSVLSGQGGFASGSTTTDEDGIATASWILGTIAGQGIAEASLDGLDAIEFTSTALPNAMIWGRVTATGEWTAPPRPELGAFAGGGVFGTAPTVTDPLPEDITIEGEFIIHLDGGFATAQAGVATGTIPRTIPQAEARAAEIRDAFLPPAAFDGTTPYEIITVQPVIGAVRIRITEGVDADEVVRALAARSDVAEVNPHMMIRLHRPTGEAAGLTPPTSSGSGPFARAASALSVSHPPSAEPALFPSADPMWMWNAWSHKMVGAWDAWRITMGDPDIIVAVVDDGIRYDHPEFDGRLLTGYNFVEATPIPTCFGGSVFHDGNGQGPGPDATIPVSFQMHSAGCVIGENQTGGHGLHVAGTIAAAANNGLFGSGVAPGVTILPVRAFGSDGSGASLASAEAILYAAGLPANDGLGGFVQTDRPSDIINMSWGSPNISTVVRDAIRAAHAEGVLLIAAAGNHGTTPVGYPARYPEVIAVGSLGPDFLRWPNSALGAEIELVAPGGHLGLGNDNGVCSTYWNFPQGLPTFQCINGTSMATPHVSGVAALVMSRYPHLTADEVRTLLRETAIPMGNQPNSSYGYGRVHAVRALTGNQGFPARPYAVLYSAEGERISSVPVGPDGSYQFTRLDPGSYHVYAGTDLDDDERVGVPGRLWSGHAAAATGRPSEITITGSEAREINFNLGFPRESGANRNIGAADLLPIGGYLGGRLTLPSTQSYYRVPVLESGRYVFYTRGLIGTCGFAQIPDTVLDLLTPEGLVIESNDDEDLPLLHLCSRIEMDLEPGTYYLRVRSVGGAGTYGVAATRH